MLTEGFRKSTTFNPFSLKFMIPVLIPPARLIVRRPFNSGKPSLNIPVAY